MNQTLFLLNFQELQNSKNLTKSIKWFGLCSNKISTGWTLAPKTVHRLYIFIFFLFHIHSELQPLHTAAANRSQENTIKPQQDPLFFPVLPEPVWNQKLTKDLMVGVDLSDKETSRSKQLGEGVAFTPAGGHQYLGAQPCHTFH